MKKGDTDCDDLWDDFGFNLFLSAFTWRDFDALFDLVMFKENKDYLELDRLISSDI